VGHNVLLAHGKSVQIIRAESKTKCKIGYAPVGIIKIPFTDKQKDIEAAMEVMASVKSKDCFNNTWWMDPIFRDKYPDDGLKLFGDAAPEIKAGDMEIISQPLDFLGINIYEGRKVFMADNNVPKEAPLAPGDNLTTMGWSVTDESLYWGPKFLYERYKIPLIITENGMANTDWVSLDGKVHDGQRIDFLHGYLLKLQQASNEGVNIKRYFVWSLMDNFEWAFGFSRRFGLVYINYITQQRLLKDSAYWYSKVIASNGEVLLAKSNKQM
jgi:beta-glucosidase